MKRRTFIAASAGGFAAFGAGWAPFSAQAQVSNINDAINKAGRQRMLSQRAAKSYMALGQKVLGTAPDRTLAASMALFDRQLVELKAFAPTAPIGETYRLLEALWNDYKAALVGRAPDKAGAERVLDLSNQVLRLANQGTVELEGVSGKAAGRLVNISGRQRMLSQRMASFYLASSWGVQATTSQAEVKKARDEFAAAHEILKAAPETTAPIKASLELAATQFTFFDIALNKLSPGAGDLQAQSNVFTTSERILQVMNDATGMYEKLS